MDAYVCHILWRTFVPFESCYSEPHVPYQHVVGHHSKRKGRLKLLQGDTKDLQEFQVVIRCGDPIFPCHDLFGLLCT